MKEIPLERGGSWRSFQIGISFCPADQGAGQQGEIEARQEAFFSPKLTVLHWEMASGNSGNLKKKIDATEGNRQRDG